MDEKEVYDLRVPSRGNSRLTTFSRTETPPQTKTARAWADNPAQRRPGRGWRGCSACFVNTGFSYRALYVPPIVFWRGNNQGGATGMQRSSIASAR